MLRSISKSPDRHLPRRSRRAGHRLLAEIDIDVDPGVSISDAHAIAEQVEVELRHHLPRLAAATVHIDPHEHPSHEIPR